MQVCRLSLVKSGKMAVVCETLTDNPSNPYGVRAGVQQPGAGGRDGGCVRGAWRWARGWAWTRRCCRACSTRRLRAAGAPTPTTPRRCGSTAAGCHSRARTLLRGLHTRSACAQPAITCVLLVGLTPAQGASFKIRPPYRIPCSRVAITMSLDV